jgi:hypothetical protein
MLSNAKLIQHFYQDSTPLQPNHPNPHKYAHEYRTLGETRAQDLGYSMDEALLDYQSSAVGLLLLQTRYVILGSFFFMKFWVHCVTFQFSSRLFQ